MKGGQRRILRRLSRRGVEIIIPCLILTVAMSVVSKCCFQRNLVVRACFWGKQLLGQLGNLGYEGTVAPT